MFRKKFSMGVVLLLTVMLLLGTLNASAADTNIAPLGTASASYCSPWEDVNAVNDGYNPSSSGDRAHAVYGNWDNPGSTQWVQYDFAQSYTISKSDVYWFRDISDGGEIDVPASCAIKYWNGSSWIDVSNPAGLGVAANTYNTTTFTPVTTSKIRLQMTAKTSNSTGILEWRVWGTASDGNTPVVATPPGWINSFYKKAVMIHGIPICSTNAVPDQALINGYNILEPYLRKISVEKPEIIQKMNQNRVYVIVIGLNETNAQHPSWAGYNDPSWPRRGGGGLNTTVLEEDLIVPSNDTWRQNFCGLVHEFTHTMLSYGLGDANHQGADMTYYNRILAAYNSAISKNLYTESSYDRSNYHEYFCGQVGRWFNGNPTDLNVPNAANLTDRQQLEIYDPAVYQICSELYGPYSLPAPWD